MKGITKGFSAHSVTKLNVDFFKKKFALFILHITFFSLLTQ